MTQIKIQQLRNIMRMAWQFVKRNGYTLSEALKTAWANVKLKEQMSRGIVRFYYRKVDGTIREAFGTLSEKLVPPTENKSDKKRNDSIQIYFDTEKSAWRSYKIANLVAR